ncbi:MAG TPA: hypothetical protein ENF57_03065 [Candidatus Korarchaeota archaeon]|nr:hypothetical protein [Candidatus Korarchaeota archaeon]
MRVEDPGGVTDGGSKLHAKSEGRPATLRETGVEGPEMGLTATRNETLLLAPALTDEGLISNVKSNVSGGTDG